MKVVLAQFLILISTVLLAGFFVTGVDVSDYPRIVVTAIADVPDPENMDLIVYEDSKKIEDIQYLGLVSSRKDAKVDVVFVFDITGSMEDEIEGMVEKSKDFADEISSAGFDYRLSLVTFRDEVVRGDYGFTTDVSEFKRWLSSLRASGGGDTPEAALDALMYAMRLPFRRDAQKILILITDAPYHHRDDGSGLSSYRPKDVRKMLSRFGVTIYAVSSDTADYRNLVAGFGKIFDIHSSGGFSRIIDDIALTIRSQFMFSYKAVGRSSGETVTFKVKAFYNGRKGRKVMEASGTYEVPPRPVVEEHEIVQEGCGTVDPNLPEQKAIVMARRAAELDAKRRILEYIKGIRIDSETTVENLMTTSDEIRSTVEGIVMGAKIVEERFEEDFGTYCVSVKVNYRYIVDKISGKPTYSISPLKGIVVARGVAIINKKLRPAGRAVLMARRGAVVVAQRNLLEAIKGVHIDSETTVEDAESESDVIVAKVEGVIKGAVIVDEMKSHKTLKEIYEAGYYWVTMAVALDEEGLSYLENKYKVGGGEALIDALKDYVTPEETYIPSSPKERSASYDAVVIDVEGLDVPYTIKGYKIFHEDGTLLFSPGVKLGKAMKFVQNLKYVEGKAFVAKAVKAEEDSIYVEGDREILESLISSAAKSGRIYVIGFRLIAKR